MMPKVTFDQRYDNAQDAKRHIIARLDDLSERNPPRFERLRAIGVRPSSIKDELSFDLVAQLSRGAEARRFM
jgi:hypothetical protein